MKGSWKKYRDCLIASCYAIKQRAIVSKVVSNGILRVKIDTRLFPGMSSEAPVPELMCEILEEKLIEKELNYCVEGHDTEKRTRVSSLQSAFIIGSRLELMFSTFRAIPEEDAYHILSELSKLTVEKLLQ